MPQPRGRTSACLPTTRTQESPLIRPRQSPQVSSRNSPSTTLVSKLRSALPRSAALRAPRCGLRVLCSRARDVALAPQLHPAGGAWFRTKLKSVDSRTFSREFQSKRWGRSVALAQGEKAGAQGVDLGKACRHETAPRAEASPSPRLLATSPAYTALRRLAADALSPRPRAWGAQGGGPERMLGARRSAGRTRTGSRGPT